MANKLVRHLTRLRKILVLAFAAGVLLTASLAGLWLVDPVAFRLFVFQPVREIRFFVNELGGVSAWSQVKRMTIAEPERISIAKLQPDDINIVADLYSAPRNEQRAPAIVLLHGSSPYGRKAGLIRLMGQTFQQRGWVVVAPDARGYGDTDDPAEVNNAAAWMVDGDVNRILEHVSRLPGIDVENIFIIGHSVGAGHALEAALDDSRVKAMILIGPARRYPGNSAGVPSLWTRARFSADRRLDDPVSGSLLQARRSRTSIAEYASTLLAQPGHIPLLVIDGENEGPDKLEYLRAVIGTTSPPVQYQTLVGTGHYCGVRSFFGSNTIYIRPDLFEPSAQLMEEFLNSHLGRGDSGEASVH